ncbi:MAG TPA: hypothetical protein VLX64_01490 [Thermoplasmata archaeon]|nr:hypothetical protein [Thermoplasmata archaeon]
MATVCVVIVERPGASLARTITALARQDRRPDRIRCGGPGEAERLRPLAAGIPLEPAIGPDRPVEDAVAFLDAGSEPGTSWLGRLTGPLDDRAVGFAFGPSLGARDRPYGPIVAEEWVYRGLRSGAAEHSAVHNTVWSGELVRSTEVPAAAGVIDPEQLAGRALRESRTGRFVPDADV